MIFEDAGFVADLKSSYHCKHRVWGSGFGVQDMYGISRIKRATGETGWQWVSWGYQSPVIALSSSWSSRCGGLLEVST